MTRIEQRAALRNDLDRRDWNGACEYVERTCDVHGAKNCASCAVRVILWTWTACIVIVCAVGAGVWWAT